MASAPDEGRIMDSQIANAIAEAGQHRQSTACGRYQDCWQLDFLSPKRPVSTLIQNDGKMHPDLPLTKAISLASDWKGIYIAPLPVFGITCWMQSIAAGPEQRIMHGILQQAVESLFSVLLFFLSGNTYRFVYNKVNKVYRYKTSTSNGLVQEPCVKTSRHIMVRWVPQDMISHVNHAEVWDAPHTEIAWTRLLSHLAPPTLV